MMRRVGLSSVVGHRIAKISLGGARKLGLCRLAGERIFTGACPRPPSKRLAVEVNRSPVVVANHVCTAARKSQLPLKNTLILQFGTVDASSRDEGVGRMDWAILFSEERDMNEELNSG